MVSVEQTSSAAGVQTWVTRITSSVTQVGAGAAWATGASQRVSVISVQTFSYSISWVAMVSVEQTSSAAGVQTWVTRITSSVTQVGAGAACPKYWASASASASASAAGAARAKARRQDRAIVFIMMKLSDYFPRWSFE